MIIHNQTINLLFSASGSWTNDYCLGLITAHVDADPIQPQSWTKRAEPLIKSGNGLFGPGHGSLTSDQWLVFHTAAYNGSGWTRQIRAQPFTWNEHDGTPVLGELRDPNVPIALPQGEPSRQRRQLDVAAQHARFDVEVGTAGLYIVAVQVRSKEPTKSTKYQLTINNRTNQSMEVFYSDHWSSILATVELISGSNSIVFTNVGPVAGEIDSLDLLRASTSNSCRPPSELSVVASFLLVFFSLFNRAHT